MKIFFLLFFLLSTGLQAAERILPVRVAEVKKLPFKETLSLTGVISAMRMTDLSAQVDAPVTGVEVEAGHLVKKGDELVQLDKELAGYEVKRATAMLEEAEAQLQESIRKSIELLKLIEKEFMAKSTYDSAVSDVLIKKAVVKRNQVDLKRAKKLLRQHTIKAPFAGVISKKMVEIGQWLNEGDPVLELVDINSLRIETQVPQRYFTKLQKGMPVKIVFDALPGREISANISYKIPVANFMSRNFPVHIEIKNQAREFTPGMTVRVTFQISTSEKPVLLVPRDAIIKKLNQADSVWMLKPDADGNSVVSVIVKTGRIAQGEVEILDGKLEPGMQVVVRGNETLRAGQKVSVSSWPK